MGKVGQDNRKGFWIRKGIKKHRWESHLSLLFNFAQDIIFMTKKVSIQELTDRRITNDKAFNIIVNSILIARYGKQTVKLNLKSNEGG